MTTKKRRKTHRYKDPATGRFAPDPGPQGWTSGELLILRDNAAIGAEALAELLGRPIRSVRSQAARMRISLRRAGERRGHVLGQPRGTSLLHGKAAAYRAAVLAGEVDPGRATRRGRLLLERGPDCPGCGKAPQETEQGLCETCAVQLLAWGHILEVDHAEALRELDRERQRKHRAKVGDNDDEHRRR